MSDETADMLFDAPAGPPRHAVLRLVLRCAAAAAVLAAAAAASCLVMVQPGQAIVITKFGDPVRVLTEPGLAWKIPAPIEGVVPVDLRLRTTSSGLQDVGTKDGLRILMQTYAAWQVASDPAHVRQFLRAARNDPDELARQIRSFMGSALQVTASNFALADLVNTDPQKGRLATFEAQLQANIASQVLDLYGVRIIQVGAERLSLPAETLAATVARMRAERETVAAERTAEGLRVAAEIRSDAARDARITAAQAQLQAAEIEAQSRQAAAAIQAQAYDIDPTLYTLVRSLATLGTVIGPKTRLVLRTDAAPFNVLVDGVPGGVPGGVQDGARKPAP
jgi:modulator of FtsH protease HflC